MNLPNRLTLLRILLIPLFLGILYAEIPHAKPIALAVFLLASLTDWLDGFLARKLHLITDFGKFADPLADKMLVTAAMLWNVQAGLMPAWIVLVVLCREFAVSGLRMIAAAKGIVLAAAFSGKIKTAATMVCLCFFFLPPFFSGEWTVCNWIILLTTLYSGAEYFIKNRNIIASC